MGPELQDFYVPGLMDLQPYTLIQAALDEEWDRFIDSSPQGNIFSQRSFLKGTRYRLGLWYCYKGKKRAAAVVYAVTRRQGAHGGQHDDERHRRGCFE